MIKAPPISDAAPGFSPRASQTHSGPRTTSSMVMTEVSAAGISRAPAVKSRNPRA